MFVNDKNEAQLTKEKQEVTEQSKMQEGTEEEKLSAQKETSSAETSSEELIYKAQETILRAQVLIAEVQKFLEERDKKARPAEINTVAGNGNGAKGVYMTGLIAAGQGDAALWLRNNIENLVLATELNAIVIDAKEADGPYVPNSMAQFVKKLKQENIWTIARIVVFADGSLKGGGPELYLKNRDGNLWRDAGGRYWLDPASPAVQEYIIQFSKQMIGLGFDELQYDYIRFPADGNLKDIVYPAYDGELTKSAVMNAFFEKLSGELRLYKKDIVLSADLFGLVAVRHELEEIGQGIEGAAKSFDYLSFMLYPSHFYGGFEIAADPIRQLPYLYYPRINQDITQVVSSHPYDVVFRSVLTASDYIASIGSSAKIRPWLQDFSLKFDTNRGIIYDAEKVRAQIEAAEQAGAAGWLLWNPANIYTEAALAQ